MSAPTVDSPLIAQTLENWLQPRLEPAAWDWLLQQSTTVAQGDKKALFLSFGLVPRKVGKSDVVLTPGELELSARIRPGWDPRQWTVDEMARVLLALRFPADDAAAYVAVLDQVFAAAEVQELIALYQGLPLYPHQSAHRWRCAEGQRSNIPAVFMAIAHHNPFPSEQLDDAQWNQLILKSLFIGVSLNPILGLDERANAALAQMLVDFAKERRAAGRAICPELWRCVGPFATGDLLKELQKGLDSANQFERKATALALAKSPDPQARDLLARANVSTAGISWLDIAAEHLPEQPG